MNHEEIIRKTAERFVAAWETADMDDVEELFLPDAEVEFSIFDAGLTVKKLTEKLAERPRKVAFTSFEIINYVCAVGNKSAQQSFSMMGLLADKKEGKWEQFHFEGAFANTLQLTDKGWKISKMLFNLTDANTAPWGKVFSSGITIEKGFGDDSFVSNWDVRQPDDRIGWYPDKRLPVIVPEIDAPWVAIKDRLNPGTDEQQIEETFFKYSYGVDNGLFELFEDVFTEDAVIKYFDDQPWDKRTVTEMLKFEKQGACRTIHTGYVKDICINGDIATAQVYLRGTFYYPDKITDEVIRKRWIWSRYHLDYRKENDIWKIHRMFFYPGCFTM